MNGEQALTVRFATDRAVSAVASSAWAGVPSLRRFDPPTGVNLVVRLDGRVFLPEPDRLNRAARYASPNEVL
ncbi:hypothetical protein Halar_1382 [halophilic archaeon DL31]|jgi:hypothetical protein|nr:hypothetical protein Halar_1382 [halophilic archaeon DL31]